MSVRAALVRVLRDLQELEVAHAVIGGLAVSARTEPRMTRDVDVAVAAADDHAAERLIYQLGQRGYSVASVLEQSAAGRLATTRLVPDVLAQSGVVVDLLFASSGIEAEVVEHAERLQILRDTAAPVAAVGHLIALKLLSSGPHRPHDASDLIRLRDAAAAEDWELARAACQLITRRGFARGRDLNAALERLYTHS